MTVTVEEYEGCFGITIKPESVEETAMLIRLALNATKDLRTVTTDALEGGVIYTDIVIGKKKQTNSTIRKGQ